MGRPNDYKKISKKELNRKISELANVVDRILSWTIYLLVRHVPKAEMEGIDAEIEVLKEKLNKILSFGGEKIQPTCSEVVFKLGKRKFYVETSGRKEIEKFIRRLKKMKSVRGYSLIANKGGDSRYIERIIELRKKIGKKFSELPMRELLLLDKNKFWLIKDRHIRNCETPEDFLMLNRNSKVITTTIEESHPLGSFMKLYHQFKKKMISKREYRKNIVLTALNFYSGKDLRRIEEIVEKIVDEPFLLKLLLEHPPSPEDLKRLKTVEQIKAYLLSNSFWREHEESSGYPLHKSL